MFGLQLQTLYKKLLAEQPTAGVVGALANIAGALGLVVDLEKEKIFPDDDGLDDAMYHLGAEAGPGVYLLSADLNPDQAHAIGVCEADAGELFVFDPNCGEYQVHQPGNFAIFLRDAYQCKLFLSFDTCYVCPVYRRQ